MRYTIEDGNGARAVDAAHFPLAVGGPGADIALPGASVEALAYIGVTEGAMFVQPASGRVSVNGTLVTTSHWLEPGDSLRVENAWIDVERSGGGIRLKLRTAEPREEPKTHLRRDTESAGSVIVPVPFEPKDLKKIARGGRSFPLAATLFVVVGLTLFSPVLWFIATARAVAIEIEPAPDRLALEGALLEVSFGGRYLLRPGSYRVLAEKEGYRDLAADVVVTGESGDFRFALEKLPGRLVVRTTPVEGATVLVDGRDFGVTPLEPIDLEAGEHEVVVTAERYREHSTRVLIEGEGTTVEIDVVLEPRFSQVTFLSDPPGATVEVAGRRFGPAPVDVELLEGNYEYEARLPGRKPELGRLRVVAGEAQTVRLGDFAPVDGVVKLLSVPGEASVTVDGEYRGQTPLEISLAPGRAHRIDVSRAGYESAVHEVEVGSGNTRTVTVELEPKLGEIDLFVDPPDAELFVNGERRGRARQLLRLPAVSHRIEVRKEGYEGFSTDVTPRPDFPQTIEVELVNLEAKKRAAKLEKRITSSRGHELVLVEPLRFQMGASRREPGRRANEGIREIEIARPFYIGAMEVTNRQFREFRNAHRSGQVASQNLEVDHHPVVRVTWEDAALYCNWLSSEESLPPAYVASGSTYVLTSPTTTGYRLPTEAEWARAARYATNASTKYPWGDSLPIPAKSGNFADVSAEGIVPATLPGYNDGFVATAPVDGFPPNALGIFQMGGNVAEWVHDRYAISPGGSGLESDPLGPDKGEFHVILGSSFLHGSVTQLRMSYRDYGKDARPDVGFRITRWAE